MMILPWQGTTPAKLRHRKTARWHNQILRTLEVCQTYLNIVSTEAPLQVFLARADGHADDLQIRVHGGSAARLWPSPQTPLRNG